MLDRTCQDLVMRTHVMKDTCAAPGPATESLEHVGLLKVQAKQVMAAYHISALPEEQFDDRCVTRGSSQVDGSIP